jgi:chromosome partitioning protein
MTLVISIINFKGGVGKTTTAINLGVALNQLKKKSLVIDLDAQGNVGMGLNIDVLKKDLITIGDVMGMGSAKIQSAIIKTPHCDIVPNNIYTYRKVNARTSYSLLDEAISPIKKEYDFIIIDCPPSIEFYTSNAIMASDLLLIVTDFSKFSIRGVEALLGLFEGMEGKVASKINHTPNVILFNKYKSTSSYRALHEKLEKQNLGIYLDVKIPESVEIMKSTYDGVPVATKKTKVAKAYHELAELFTSFVAKKKVYNSKTFKKL